MGEVLSQNEIDNLLKQLSSGELDVDEYIDKPSQKIKDYDFARPAKFSKEHLRTLEIIFESAGISSKKCPDGGCKFGSSYLL